MTTPEVQAVDPDKVVAALLADGWHQVAAGTFSVGLLDFGAGQIGAFLGFRFEEVDGTSLRRTGLLAGPLESVLAVREFTGKTALRGLDGYPAYVR